MGACRSRARAGCCPGCRSPSASASSSISPPSVSRPGGRRCRWRSSASRSPMLARQRAVGFPLALGVAGVAGGLCHCDAARPRARASGAAAIRPGASRSRALSRCARSASAPTASWCASQRIEGRRIAETPRARAASRCARAPRRRSAASSRSRRICRRRSRRCGRAATISRATCISSASAPRASRSARSRSTQPPARAGALAALRVAFVDAHARRDRQAHPRRVARRPRRDRLGADHRQARRHHHAGQRRDVHFEPRRMCCRSPAITWRWSPASCSSVMRAAARADARRWRAAVRSRNGRRSARSSRPRFICCCRARRSRRSAPSS